MNDIKTKRKRRMAISIIEECRLFSEPQILFALFYEHRDGITYQIGICDECDIDKRFLLITDGTNHQLRHESEISYASDYQRLLEENLAGYFLIQLMEKNEISYLSISFHVELYGFVSNYFEEVECIVVGVTFYLAYCEDIGVTNVLIENCVGIEFNNLIDAFLYHYNANYENLLSQKVGDSLILLQFMVTENDKANYVVLIYDLVSKEQIYKEYFNKLPDAHTDYMRQFYIVSIAYYERMETQFIDTINEHIECLEKEGVVYK